jgi:hypothetical protein
MNLQPFLNATHVAMSISTVGTELNSVVRNMAAAEFFFFKNLEGDVLFETSQATKIGVSITSCLLEGMSITEDALLSIGYDGEQYINANNDCASFTGMGETITDLQLDIAFEKLNNYVLSAADMAIRRGHEALYIWLYEDNLGVGKLYALLDRFKLLVPQLDVQILSFNTLHLAVHGRPAKLSVTNRFDSLNKVVTLADEINQLYINSEITQ